MRTHRRAAAALSVLALTAALTGCSDDGGSDAPPPADSGVGDDGDPVQPGDVAPSG